MPLKPDVLGRRAPAVTECAIMDDAGILVALGRGAAAQAGFRGARTPAPALPPPHSPPATPPCSVFFHAPSVTLVTGPAETEELAAKKKKGQRARKQCVKQAAKTRLSRVEEKIARLCAAGP